VKKVAVEICGHCFFTFSLFHFFTLINLYQKTKVEKSRSDNYNQMSGFIKAFNAL